MTQKFKSSPQKVSWPKTFFLLCSVLFHELYSSNFFMCYIVPTNINPLYCTIIILYRVKSFREGKIVTIEKIILFVIQDLLYCN
jgi:hypothetical protein